jgi:hypothetical protein
MDRVEDFEAIRQLKYRYFRCLDSKDWEGLGATLTDDVTTAYDGGKYAHRGRTAVLEFLSGALGSPRILSMHHGHHPEIEITGPTTARATWYLEDLVIFRDADTQLRGAGFYHDQYVKTGDGWRIAHTGYERTFELFESTASIAHLKSRFDTGPSDDA